MTRLIALILILFAGVAFEVSGGGVVAWILLAGLAGWAAVLVVPGKGVATFPLRAWLGTEIIVWGITFLFLQYGVGFHLSDDPEYRLYLVALYLGGAFGAVLLAGPSFGPVAYGVSERLAEVAHPRNFQKIENCDQLLTAITVVYYILYFGLGGLTARSEVGNNITADQAFYWLRGLEAIPYPFFFVRGLRWAGSRQNSLILFPIALISLLLLTGGRGIAFYHFVLLAIGALCSQQRIPFKSLLRYAVVCFLALMVFQKIGEIRLSRQFEDAETLEERFWAVVHHEPEIDTAPRVLFMSEETLLRLNEPFGEIVIEGSRESERAGFENFDRLRHLFVPAFLAPDKLPLDDGPEVLRDDFGLDVTDHKSLPITLLADCYRRWGEAGVLLGGAVVPLLIMFTVWATYQIRNPLLFSVAISQLILQCTRLYPFSALGLIGYLSYTYGRNLIICGMILWIASRSSFTQTVPQTATDTTTNFRATW